MYSIARRDNAMGHFVIRPDLSLARRCYYKRCANEATASIVERKDGMYSYGYYCDRHKVEVDTSDLSPVGQLLTESLISKPDLLYLIRLYIKSAGSFFPGGANPEHYHNANCKLIHRTGAFRSKTPTHLSIDYNIGNTSLKHVAISGEIQCIECEKMSPYTYCLSDSEEHPISRAEEHSATQKGGDMLSPSGSPKHLGILNISLELLGNLLRLPLGVEIEAVSDKYSFEKRMLTLRLKGDKLKTIPEGCFIDEVSANITKKDYCCQWDWSNCIPGSEIVIQPNLQAIRELLKEVCLYIANKADGPVLLSKVIAAEIELAGIRPETLPDDNSNTKPPPESEWKDPEDIEPIFKWL